MRWIVGIALGFGIGLVMALPAQAAGVALVIANDSYEAQPDSRDAARLAGTVRDLEAAGFSVVTGTDLSTEEMRAQLAGAHEQIRRAGAERVVVVLSGHFARSRSGTWLMGVEAGAPGLALVDGAGLRLDTVFEIAAEARDSAIIWLAEGGGRPDFGAQLEAGLPPRFMVPQGVGVVRGTPRHVATGLRDVLRPGTILAAVVDGTRQLTGEGAIPVLVPFLPDGFAPEARVELQAWRAAEDAATEEAYESYLAAFPDGQNAAAARAALESLRNAPDRLEEALALTRDERRAIQQDLTLLGFDTRGIDGIFGPGTRASIRGWQGREDLEPTGFLTREQIFTLAAQGSARAAEIKAEARARRAAEEDADRAFWADTGAEGGAPELRAYLQRYPQGIFAGLARDRLAAIEAEARAALRAEDEAAWRRARQIDTIAAYTSYLDTWPEGDFAEAAQGRIDARQPITPEPVPAPAPAAPAPVDPATAQARAQEEALGLSQATRQLIEQRLVRLGLDPGPVDGVFDDQTRVAIAQAQERFDLRQSGYVNQDLLTMMLSAAFQEFFR